MRRVSGDKILDFEISDFDGKSIKLSEIKSKKILLSFYRYASCPLCNLRIHELIKRYPIYRQNGLHVLAFFESSRDSMAEYVGKQETPFPLIPDPERRVYKLYGVEYSIWKYIKGVLNGKLIEAIKRGFHIGKMENKKTLVPADFLIENGVIKQAYYGKDISDHIPFQDIEDFI